MIRTSNPAFRPGVFTPEASAGLDTHVPTMTIAGAAQKTLILLALVVLAAGFTWSWVGGAPEDLMYQRAMPFFIGGMIGGLLLAVVTTFKTNWAPVTAPMYALVKGLFLGTVSVMLDKMYPGIAVQAVLLTLAVLAGLLAIYSTGIIKVTDKFRIGVAAAVGAVFVVYLVSIAMSLMGFGGIPMIHEGGPIGIGFSLVVIVIACLAIITDFDLIERGAAEGAPRRMEWYAGFALLVTILWLYIEILRLLAKLRR